jgi:uncharacterized protein YdbL (DUF1318 family)
MASPSDELVAAVAAVADYRAAGVTLLAANVTGTMGELRTGNAGADDSLDASTAEQIIKDADAARDALEGGRTSGRIAAL